MWEWIGSGFASTGAASTSNVIEEAALPFDKRRNGLVLGMGAASFVVERKSSADERGVQPIAELLGATTANSAYHGTRLDVEHVATTVDNFVGEMENKWGLDRHAIAKTRSSIRTKPTRLLAEEAHKARSKHFDKPLEKAPIRWSLLTPKDSLATQWVLELKMRACSMVC